MENISYVGLSQQIAIQQQMDITANNIANMSTPGYKSQNILFSDYITKPKSGDNINQVINYATYRDLAPGSFSQTGNSLDVALNGDGYFTVQTPNGMRYTRDGSFALNANREIITKSGYQVMGDGGGPIVIPAEATHITITPDGTVSTEQGDIAKLKVVDFDNAQKMKRDGENLLEAGSAREKPVDKTTVSQGTIEASNVNPVLEMNKMIELLRMFEASQRMLLNDHERIRTAIQKLTRV